MLYIFKVKLEKNQTSQAYAIRDILVDCAKSKKPITYSQVYNESKIQPIAQRFALGIIHDFCIDENLPLLPVLVINKNTRKPGKGFNSQLSEIAEERAKVFKHPWDMKNPFRNA